MAGSESAGSWRSCIRGVYNRFDQVEEMQRAPFCLGVSDERYLFRRG